MVAARAVGAPATTASAACRCERHCDNSSGARAQEPVASWRPIPQLGREVAGAMSDLRGALEVLLVRRRLAHAGKAELAPLLLGDLASMACAADIGRAGNAKSPPGVPDGLGVFSSSEMLGCGDGQPQIPVYHGDHLTLAPNLPRPVGVTVRTPSRGSMDVQIFQKFAALCRDGVGAPRSSLQLTMRSPVLPWSHLHWAVPWEAWRRPRLPCRWWKRRVP
jgi:hypothetical protein